MKKTEVEFYLNYIKKHPMLVFGFVMTLLNVIFMFFGYQLAPYNPIEANPADVLQPPSAQHWFGTDSSGMDIFSRVIAAPKVDLWIAFAATTLAVVIGSPLGVISGYNRGILSEVIARVLDIIQVFPPFILAMAFVAISGQNINNVITVIAATNAPMFARLLRSKVYTLREARFVEAAKCIGNSELSIIFKHLLPNSWQVVFIQFSVNIGWAILLTSGLSFVGAGVRVPTPEWGSMIAIGAPNIITGGWWVAFFPGLALGLTVLGFAILGEASEYLLDPTKR